MKKRFVFIITLCAVLVAITLVSCSDPGAPKHSVSTNNYTVSASSIEQKLEEFLTQNPDRTAGSIGEAAAAEYLQQELTRYGFTSAVISNSFRISDGGKDESQNVSAVYEEDGAKYNVIIGAYYDNCYGFDVDNSYDQIAAEGALSNGSGVAAVLAVAEYLAGEHEKLGFNVTIAFFGSSAERDVGATEFYETMDRKLKSNTVLMVEMQRLGVDHVYAYVGPSTEREVFFDRVASDNKLDIYKVSQKSPHILGTTVLDGVPYYQWAQTGLYASFYNGGIPTLNVVGGNWETISFTDTESAFHGNIGFTKNDTLENFKRLYPDYASKIALASSFVISSLHDGEFLSVMLKDKQSFNPNTAITEGWIWGLVAIGILIVFYLIMNVAVKIMGKKYPIPVPQPKKIKMAVFGVDYEDKNPNDIFIDFADPFSDLNGSAEIFPGVPNNDRTAPFVPPVFSFGQKDNNFSDNKAAVEVDDNNSSDENRLDDVVTQASSDNLSDKTAELNEQSSGKGESDTISDNDNNEKVVAEKNNNNSENSSENNCAHAITSDDKASTEKTVAKAPTKKSAAGTLKKTAKKTATKSGEAKTSSVAKKSTQTKKSQSDIDKTK